MLVLKSPTKFGGQIITLVTVDPVHREHAEQVLASVKLDLDRKTSLLENGVILQPSLSGPYAALPNPWASAARSL